MEWAETKLFAVYLGGTAEKCNTEFHDVVFVTGASIEYTYEQLMDKWFGTPLGLHLDSWMEVEAVDGYRVSLSKTPSQETEKLFFVNLGAYRDGEFTEYHANKLLIAANQQEAKVRAKKELFPNWETKPHTDNLYEVDTCIELSDVGGYYINLTKTGEADKLNPTNGYYLVPKGVVEEYMNRKAKAA